MQPYNVFALSEGKIAMVGDIEMRFRLRPHQDIAVQVVLND